MSQQYLIPELYSYFWAIVLHPTVFSVLWILLGDLKGCRCKLSSLRISFIHSKPLVSVQAPVILPQMDFPCSYCSFIVTLPGLKTHKKSLTPHLASDISLMCLQSITCNGWPPVLMVHRTIFPAKLLTCALSKIRPTPPSAVFLKRLSSLTREWALYFCPAHKKMDHFGF
jgi:hypothetical protein